MTEKAKILSFLRLLRESHPDMVAIFTKGSCLNLFLLLRNQYPDAEPYYNSDHIITKIGTGYYDITGVVSPKGYLPFTWYYDKKRTSRAFTQMYKAGYKK